MNTRYEQKRAYYLANRDHINALRRARRALLRSMPGSDLAKQHREYLDCAKLVCLFTTGHGCRCGFSKTTWNGSKKIAARRREVYARMAKIKDGWRTK